MLGWEAEAVVRRALGHDGPPIGPQMADRFSVLEQLVAGHLAAREEPPPGGARLATVVLEQLAGEPARRSLGAAGHERLAQRFALPVGRLLLFGDFPRRGDFGPHGIVGTVSQEPIAKRQRRPAIVLVVDGDGGKRLVVARVHPALVFQYRAGTGRNSRSPPEFGKRLDLLQRVARYTGAQTLPHDAVQVNEDLAAQQLVDG